MARTYMAVVEVEEKGKVPVNLTFETTAKRENDARHTCLSAAVDAVQDGAKCSILCVSRLKKGVPVKAEMFDHKTDEILVLDPADFKVIGKTVACTGTSKKLAPIITPIVKPLISKAPSGKPKLYNMLSDSVVADMAAKDTWITYDKFNKEIYHDEKTG